MGEISYDQKVASLPVVGAKTAKLALRAELTAAKGAAQVARWLTGKLVETAPVPFIGSNDHVTVDKDCLGELGFTDEHQAVVGEVLDNIGREVDKNRPLGVNRAAGDLVYIVGREMPEADPADRAERFTRVVTEATSLSPTEAQYMLKLQDPQRLLQ